MTNKLSDGVVGGKLVQWFKDNENRDNLPVDSETLENNIREDYANYRLSFEDGTVADYKVTFEHDSWFDIESVEEFNRVI
jgi:hypothetical protein